MSRLKATLGDIRSVLGQREVCIAREMTKKHEEFIFLTLGSDYRELPELLGEVTVLVAPGKRDQGITSEEEVIRIMRRKFGPDDGARSVVERTLPHVSRWGKKALYELFLREMQGKGSGTEDP